MRRTVVAALLAGAALTLTSPVWAEKPPTVNHPTDCSGTLIVDQPPNSGLTVTVAYTGTMYLKISNQHVTVPVVTVGEVYTPDNLSSWPRNQNSQPQEISHVDYCVETVDTTTTTTTTTTTQPPVVTVNTVPTTTVAETTTTVAETTTTEPPPEVCLQHRTGGPELPEGEYVELPSSEGATGTTRWGIQWCAPVIESTTTTQPLPKTLPTTGSSNWLAVNIAALLLLGGGGLALLARRA